MLVSPALAFSTIDIAKATTLIDIANQFFISHQFLAIIIALLFSIASIFR